MTRRSWTVIALSFTVSACNLGFELDFSDFELDWPDELNVRGEVYSGSDPAIPAEFVVRLFAPTDTLHPIADPWLTPWICDTGAYCVWFGPYPDSAACGYLVQLERWDGVLSDKKRLFVAPPVPCSGMPATASGPRFDFPAYAPLDPPFALTGVVYVDSVRAGAGVTATISSGAGTQSVLTDASGRYTLATTDAAARLRLCLGVSGTVSLGTRVAMASLGPIPFATCGVGRELPDIRVGWPIAVIGVVRSAGLSVGRGAAHVEILRPSDSAVVGDTAWTRDDGGYQLWLPYGTPFGCDYLVRATTATASETRPMQGPTTGPCVAPMTHAFWLP